MTKPPKLDDFEPPQPRLKSMTVTSLLNRNFPPKKPVLGPIAEKDIGMFFGIRGLGKSHLMLGSAIAAASGGELLGLTAPKPRRVLVIDSEMAVAEQQARARRALSFPGVKYPPRGNLRFVFADCQEGGIRDIATEEGQRDLDEIIDDAEVIFLDNISSLSRSGKENEAESWIPIQEWALSQRRAGRTIIFIHHAGKGGAQRGTSKREDCMDFVIALRPVVGADPSDGARFEVHFEKARSFYGDAAKAFEARLTPDGWIRTPLGVRRESDDARALHATGLTQRESAKRLNISPSTVNRIINTRS